MKGKAWFRKGQQEGILALEEILIKKEFLEMSIQTFAASKQAQFGQMTQHLWQAIANTHPSSQLFTEQVE